MAKTSLIMKSQRTAQVQGADAQPLQALRAAARLPAQVPGCRLCFRELALKGEVPGVIKASW